jgi:hypothetical protein
MPVNEFGDFGEIVLHRKFAEIKKDHGRAEYFFRRVK